jgi:all-trans-8'-apo-beta-carotenal 15,15'-oxygenase
MVSTTRREAFQLMAAAGGMMGLPGWAQAATSDPVFAAFEAARDQRPWTLGFVDAPATGLDGEASLIQGALPEGLAGVLHRNGPGRFSRADWRYRHWFDGDGLVHAWQISDAGISHRARFVETPKWRSEEAAGRFLLPALGSIPPEHRGLSGPDDMNVANTSVLMVGDELLALWEGGSAWRLDPANLESRGPQVWGDGLQGLPFSAHPSRDLDGTVWNFGQDARSGRMLIWKIAASGELENVELVGDVPGGMTHDFVITDRSLVFLIGGYRFEELRLPFIDSFKWDGAAPMRAIAFDKNDLTRRREWDLPPGFLFHFGGAWEEQNGTIHLDAALAQTAEFAADGAYRVMRGEPGDASLSQSRMTRISLMERGRTQIDVFDDGFAEMPQIDTRFIGQRRAHTWHFGWGLDQPDGATTIVDRNVETGQSTSFDYGPDKIVEEPLFIPRPGSSAEGDGWLIHTALDLRAEATELHVLDARDLASGPVGSWRLPYACPLGFHGCWREL